MQHGAGMFEPGGRLEERRTDRRTAPARAARVARLLPAAAFAFVIAALLALAVAPGVLLNRLVQMGEEMVQTVLPTYDRLRSLALAMERQSVAVRGWILTGDERYQARFAESLDAERAALQELAALAPRIGPVAAAHFDALQRLTAQQHQQNLSLIAAGAEAYSAALPQLDAVRDSMLLHLVGLDQELVALTQRRLEEEARWAGRQRTIALLLGGLALAAALVVGWFAGRQERLTRAVEAALTEANTAQAVAERRRAELERVTESRARLMRGFGHDVKNPLGAADGYLQLLRDGIVGPLTDAQLRSVERAGRSIAASMNLVDDLLELARTEHGHVEIAPMPTDLREVVQAAAQEYQAAAEAKGLSMHVHVPPGMRSVITDGRRVRQVLGNLISNAVKYTRAGRVDVTLEPAADEDGNRIAIHVSDTGPGIPPEQRELLFEEFVRLDPGAARGAGIGLTISQRIAQALGGEITVTSEPGQGSTFTLRLPAAWPQRAH